MVIQSQLLATKFFVPITLGILISLPRLHTLLDTLLVAFSKESKAQKHLPKHSRQERLL